MNPHVPPACVFIPFTHRDPFSTRLPPALPAPFGHTEAHLPFSKGQIWVRTASGVAGQPCEMDGVSRDTYPSISLSPPAVQVTCTDLKAQARQLLAVGQRHCPWDLVRGYLGVWGTLRGQPADRAWEGGLWGWGRVWGGLWAWHCRSRGVVYG